MARMTDKQVFEHCAENWRWAREYYRPWNDLFGRLLAFCLDLEHYKRDPGITNDRRRIQPKGQQLYNLIRHKLSQLSTAVLNLVCNPTQPMSDGTKSEVAKRLLEQVILDPLKRYKLVRRRMILGALSAGRGATAIEYDPRVGVCFRSVDPRKLHICPGFFDIHDPRNPWVIEEVPMRLSEVKAMKKKGWKVPSDLMPDDWKSDYNEGSSQDTSRITFEGDGNQPGAGEGDVDGIVTILKCFYRVHPDGREQEPAPKRDLPRDEWHYLDPTTGERIPAGPELDDDVTPPPVDEMGMPLTLVTENESEDQFPSMPDGYLCIIAPHYKNHMPLFMGSWLPGKVNEEVTLSAFPFMLMLGYHHPLRLIGTSDTQLNHSLQVIDNASFRAAWEQMRMAQAVISMLKGAFEDESGNQFKMTDQPVQIAYARDRIASEAGISIHQAPGMNQAMPGFRNMLSQQWTYIGTGDISMPAERSRDVAVGTMQAMQQMGDLPVRLHLEDLAMEEAVGFRVVLDYVRAYMTAEQLVTWLADDGDQMYAMVRPEDLSPMNVMVSPPAEKNSMDAERIQAVAQFAGQTAQSPELMMALLPETSFSPATKRALGELAQKMMAMQEMQMNPQGAQGAPPPDEGAPPMQ